MTQDSGGLEDYHPAPTRQCVQGAGGTHLPIAGYGRLPFKVDQSRECQGPDARVGVGTHHTRSESRAAKRVLDETASAIVYDPM